MIGKTAPIAASVATARKTGSHVFEGPENEHIRVLSGSPEDVLDYVQDAQTSGIKNGFVHAKIAPDHTQTMTADQWQHVIKSWCEEFKLDPENVCAVLHEKGGNAHLHIIAPGCDPVTGRRTDVSWCHLRTEKLCRKLEADFGHSHVPMKPGHVRSVAARLRAEGRPEVADAINMNPTVEGAAFSEKQGQRLKRDDYSPTRIKQIVRACWDCSDSGHALSNALAEFGFSVAPGKRKNVWIVSSEDGTELGALDRIVDEKRAMVAARMAPDKPRRSKKPSPIKLPQPLPAVPPKPPAAPTIHKPETQPQTAQELHHEDPSTTPTTAQPERARSTLEDPTRHAQQHERDFRPARPPAAGERRGRGAGPIRGNDAGSGRISADSSTNKIPTSRLIEIDSKGAEERGRNKKRKAIRRQRFEAGYHRHRARMNALAHRQNRQAERERKALSRAEKYARDNPIFFGLAALATRLTGINFIPEQYKKFYKIAEDARVKTEQITKRLQSLQEQSHKTAESRLPDTDELARKRQEQHDRRDRIERKAQENILKSQEESRRISIAEERNISKRPDNTNEHHPAPGR